MEIARATLCSKISVILVCPNIKKQRSTLKALSNISCNNKIQINQKENMVKFRNGSSITCLVPNATEGNIHGKRVESVLSD